MVVESRSTDFPVEWTRETFSTPDKPDVDRRIHHRVTMVADRQDTAAQSASLVTLLRVADRLSSMEKTAPPSKYRTTFVSYEEVVCSRRHKLHVAPASFWSLHARCVLDGIDRRMKYFRKLLLAVLLSLCILLVSLFFEKKWILIFCPPAIKNRSA